MFCSWSKSIYRHHREREREREGVRERERERATAARSFYASGSYRLSLGGEGQK